SGLCSTGALAGTSLSWRRRLGVRCMRPGLFSLLFTSYPDRGGPDGADAVSPALLQSCLSVCRLRSAGYYGDVEPGNGRAIRLDSPGMNGKLESVRAGDTSNSLHRWTSMTVAWMLAIFF